MHPTPLSNSSRVMKVARELYGKKDYINLRKLLEGAPASETQLKDFLARLNQFELKKVSQIITAVEAGTLEVKQACQLLAQLGHPTARETLSKLQREVTVAKPTKAPSQIQKTISSESPAASPSSIDSRAKVDFLKDRLQNTSDQEEWFDEGKGLVLQIHDDKGAASVDGQRGKKRLTSIFIKEFLGDSFQGSYAFKKQEERETFSDNSTFKGILKSNDILHLELANWGWMGRKRRYVLERTLTQKRERRQFVAKVIGILWGIVIVLLGVILYASLEDVTPLRRQIMWGSIATISIIYGIFRMVYRPLMRREWGSATWQILKLGAGALIFVPNIPWIVNLIGDVIIFCVTAVVIMIGVHFWLEFSSSDSSTTSSKICPNCNGIGLGDGPGGRCYRCRGTGRIS